MIYARGIFFYHFLLKFFSKLSTSVIVAYKMNWGIIPSLLDSESFCRIGIMSTNQFIILLYHFKIFTISMMPLLSYTYYIFSILLFLTVCLNIVESCLFTVWQSLPLNHCLPTYINVTIDMIVFNSTILLFSPLFVSLVLSLFLFLSHFNQVVIIVQLVSLFFSIITVLISNGWSCRYNELLIYSSLV